LFLYNNKYILKADTVNALHCFIFTRLVNNKHYNEQNTLIDNSKCCIQPPVLFPYRLWSLVYIISIYKLTAPYLVRFIKHVKNARPLDFVVFAIRVRLGEGDNYQCRSRSAILYQTTLNNNQNNTVNSAWRHFFFFFNSETVSCIQSSKFNACVLDKFSNNN